MSSVFLQVDCDILQQFMEGLSCDESFDGSDDDGDTECWMRGSGSLRF